MVTRIQYLASALAIGGFAALASAPALAQAEWNGGGSEALSQSTVLMTPTSTASAAQVYQDALAAARPAETEVAAQSTALQLSGSTVAASDVYQGAYAAARPADTEAIGQSTALPLPGSSN